MNHVRCVARFPPAQQQHAPLSHHGYRLRVTTALGWQTATTTPPPPPQRRSVFVWKPHEWRDSKSGQTRVPPFPQAEQPMEVSPDGHRTLRKRKYGNPSLPLPAFMDPLLLKRPEERTARKTTSVDIDQNTLTEFQKELRCNPYAAALATPVRQCQITLARVPQHFCLRFTTDYSGCLLPDPRASSADSISDTTKSATGVSLPYFRYWGSSVKRNIDMMHVLSNEKFVKHLNVKKNWTALPYERIRVHWSRFMQKRAPPNPAMMFQWDRETPGIVIRDLKEDVIRKMKAALYEGEKEEEMEEQDVDIKADTEEAQWKRMLVPLDQNAVAVDGGCQVLNGIIVCGEVDEDSAIVDAAREMGLRLYRLRYLLASDIPEDIHPLSLHPDARAWGVVKDPGSVPLLMALHKLEDYGRNRKQASPTLGKEAA